MRNDRQSPDQWVDSPPPDTHIPHPGFLRVKALMNNDIVVALKAVTVYFFSPDDMQKFFMIQIKKGKKLSLTTRCGL